MKYFCSFSEAIREGSKLRPQAFGDWFDGNGTCALGAAADAMLGVDHKDGIDLNEFWPYISTADATCPACPSCGVHAHLAAVVMLLNDSHKWTREAIADWIELEEEKLGFITLIESESPASQPELSLSPQPEHARASVFN